MNLWTLPLLDNVFLDSSCKILIFRNSAFFSRSCMLQRKWTLSSQTKMFKEKIILSFQWKYKWSILWYVVLLFVCFCTFPLSSYAWRKALHLKVLWLFFFFFRSIISTEFVFKINFFILFFPWSQDFVCFLDLCPHFYLPTCWEKAELNAGLRFSSSSLFLSVWGDKCWCFPLFDAGISAMNLLVD